MYQNAIHCIVETGRSLLYKNNHNENLNFDFFSQDCQVGTEICIKKIEIYIKCVIGWEDIVTEIWCGVCSI